MIIHDGGLWTALGLCVLGWVQLAMAAAPAIASLFGGAAKGRAQGRADETNILSERDRNALYGYNVNQGAQTTALQGEEKGKLDRAQLDLLRRKFAQDAPTARARQAALGDIMANVQDVKMSGLGGRVKPMQFSGGLRPSALGPNARQAGAELSRQALMSMLAGEKFDDVAATDFQKGVLKTPKASPLPQATGLDKFLNIGSAVAGGLGVLGDVMDVNKASKYAPPSPNDPRNAVTLPNVTF